MKSKLILLLIAVSLFAEPIQATGTLDSSQDSIVAKVSSIDAFVTKYKKIIENLPQIIAYTRIGYLTDNETSNFAVNNVYIGVAGGFAKKFDYLILADLANPRILDASFTYKPFDQLNITIGQFKVPFTIGNTYTTLGEECINFPLAVQRMVGFDDVCGIKGGAGRDIGVSLSGGFIKQKTGLNLIEYTVAMMNGNGSVLKDNNKSKDIFGRINLHPSRELTLSASAMRGEYGENYVVRHRFSGGASFTNRLMSLRAEYIFSKSSVYDSYGAYALILGKITDKIEVLTRFDMFSETDTKATPIELNYTAGVNYRPFKFLRLQANYVRRTYSESKHSAPDLFQAMVTGVF